MEPVIFFSSPPVLDDLCAVTVRVKKSCQNQVISQPHVLKCREFIFSESGVIASPSYDYDCCFNIIMQISFCKTGRLQSRMQKLGLEFSKPFRAHPTLYQSCLRYTVTARLAPLWNKAGEWLIQGRDFVTHHGYANAVKLNLCVNKDEIFASLCGTIVRSPPLQVEDLNLSRQEMLNILKSTQEDGRQVELQDSWCHVLPSTKRGRILSVSLLMPSESPFSGYKELKRHWKNTYGYRLPETDEDILYCQVSFLPSGTGKQFTYPDVCLRNRPAQCMSRVDCKPILSSFIQDIHARMGQVCGQPLRFTPKMHFTSVSLLDADEDIHHASLSNKRKNIGNGKLPLRSSQNIALIKQKSFSQDEPSLRSKLAIQTGADTKMLLSDGADKTTNKNIDIDSKKCEQYNTQSKPYLSDNEKHSHSGLGMDTTSTVMSSCDNMSNSNFDKSCFISNQTINPVSAENIEKLPLPSKRKTNITYPESANKPKLSNIDHTPTHLSSASQSKLIPIFLPQKRGPSNIIVERKNDSNSHSAKFTPVFKSMPLSSSSTDKTHCPIPATMPSFSQLNGHNKNIKAMSSDTVPNTTKTSLFPVFIPKPKTPVINHKQIITPIKPLPSRQLGTPVSDSLKSSMSLSQAMTKSPASGPKTIPHWSSRDVNFTTGSPSSQHKMKTVDNTLTPTYPGVSPRISCGFKESSSGKRKMDLSETGTVISKKPRSKPQIQDLDIDSLARCNQLNKANTATLTMWLKERGVTCRVKDKKPDLIQKVQDHLGLSLSLSEP